MSDADVEVRFGATITALTDAIKQAGGQLKVLQDQVEGVNDTFKKMGEIVGVALTVDGLKNFIESMAELGLQTERSMATLGLTADQVGIIGGVAKLTGQSMEGLSLNIERLSLNIQNSTRSAVGPAAEALKVLGLNAKELIGIPTDQYILKLADAVSKFNPSLNVTNAVMALGGRGIAQMIPFLMEGREGFARFQEGVRATGVAFSDVNAKGFAQTHENITDLGMAIQGFGIKVFADLKPVIDDAAKAITKFIESIDANMIRTALQSMAGIATSVVQAIGTFMIDLSGMLARILGLIDTIKAKWDSVFGTIKAVMAWHDNIAKQGGLLGIVADGNWGALAGKTSGDKFGNAFANSADLIIAGKQQALAAKMKSWTDGIAAELAKIGGQGEDPILAGQGGRSGLSKDKQNAGGLGGVDAQAAKDRVAAEIAADDAIMASAKNLADRKISLAQFQLQTHKISLTQEVQAERDALNEEYDKELETLEKERAIRGLTLAEKAKLDAKIEELAAKHELKLQQLEQKTAEKVMADGKAWTDFIFGAWNSQIAGLIDGTESWGTAFKKTISSMAATFIEMVAKMIEEWAILEAISLVTGAPMPALSTIVSSSLPHFDVGAWSLPQDMVAQVHKGEMIVPASAAQPFRDMMSGGDRSADSSNTPKAGTSDELHGMIGTLISTFQQGMRQNNGAVTRLHRTVHEATRRLR